MNIFCFYYLINKYKSKLFTKICGITHRNDPVDAVNTTNE